MSRYQLAMSPTGTRMQSGLPKGSPADGVLRARGMTLQGVVVTVYVYDSHQAANTVADGTTPNTIYCDVLCYGKHEGVVPRVLVTHGERAGLQEGDISIPRATTIAVNGPLDQLQTNPAMMDGDHVIIGFLEDDLKKPFILRYMSHPSSDIGNDGNPAGQRMRLKEADGQPRFTKHKGSYWGIDADGNMVFDLTKAHDGSSYQSTGAEPPPLGDGSVGNVTLKLPAMAKVTVQIDGGASFVLDKNGADATSTLGDGAVHTAISEHLEDLWNELVQWLSMATVLTSLGPSAPFPTIPGPPPAWAAAIQSGKMSLPDG